MLASTVQFSNTNQKPQPYCEHQPDPMSRRYDRGLGPEPSNTPRVLSQDPTVCRHMLCSRSPTGLFHAAQQQYSNPADAVSITLVQ